MDNNAQNNKILLVHGLFMCAAMMRPLANWLRQQGYQSLSLTYPTRRQSLAKSVAQQLPCIQEFSDGAPLYAIGHSLGGLYLRHLQQQWPQGLGASRVVTLGTPHLGSKVGCYFHDHPWRKHIIAHCWEQGLDGNAPPWPTDIPLLSIAGTKALGIGAALRIFTSDEPNDGTVAVSETELPQAAALHQLPTSHTALQFSRTAAMLAVRWFRDKY